MKRIALLGSTGSIGTQTLDVVRRAPGKFRVVAMAAGRRIEPLAEQVREFRPSLVAVADDACAAKLRSLIPPEIEIAVGEAGLLRVAEHPAEVVMAALVGAVGLRPALAALRAGRTLALANKEVMVMAGALVRREAEAHGAAILPVDSEHSAVFQALSGQRACDVSKIVLTASGGPFRGWSAERIAAATIEEALRHPNWAMGPKITIDSATLMNKGLEVIEARWLFDVRPDQIDVVVHPQSIVHSLVEFCDGSVLAQLGLPDMRVPIAVALAHPERVALEIPRLDLTAQGRLEFEAPDRELFPCLDLAYRALAGDELAPAALNAANEVAVAAFLAGRIAFPEIAERVAEALDAHLLESRGATAADVECVLEADRRARAHVERQLGPRSPRPLQEALSA